jgi:hypothetical protein
MESLAYLWDELDDVAGACRHVATCTVAEVLVPALPFIAAASTVLLAAAATVLLVHRQLLSVVA